MLYQEYREATGFDIVPRHQGSAPNCVGQAAAAAIDIFGAIEGGPLPGRADAAFIYGVSRVDHGSTGRAGATCSWAVQALTNTGVVPMLEYPLIDVDIRTEDPARNKAYGSRGPPDALRVIAADYKLAEYYQVRNWQQLRGALDAGHPVIFGSSVGFGTTSGQVRSQGFLHSRWWSSWPHAMVFIGYDDRPGHASGALVLNSWGSNWVRGPQKIGDEPEGTFWVTPKDANKLLARADAFAIGGVR